MLSTPEPSFEWNEEKNRSNREKHGVGFELAQRAFVDPRRIIMAGIGHSEGEERFFCLWMIAGGVMTVRFTWREGRIRIFGAGYWRKGRRVYERENG